MLFLNFASGTSLNVQKNTESWKCVSGRDMLSSLWLHSFHVSSDSPFPLQNFFWGSLYKSCLFPSEEGCFLKQTFHICVAKLRAYAKLTSTLCSCECMFNELFLVYKYTQQLLRIYFAVVKVFAAGLRIFLNTH